MHSQRYHKRRSRNNPVPGPTGHKTEELQYAVEITDFDPARKNSLIQFLRRHSRSPFQYTGLKFEERGAIVYMTSRSSVDSLLDLNGIVFHGQRLGIVLASEPMDNMMEAPLLRDILTPLYDPHREYLNLAGIIHHPHSLELRIDFYNKSFVSQLVKTLAHVLQDSKISALNLESNSLKYLPTGLFLCPLFKHLKSLSLKDNRLCKYQDWKVLEKLECLEELVLENNPVNTRHDSATKIPMKIDDVVQYFQNVRQKLTRLMFLDRVRLADYFGDNSVVVRNSWFDSSSVQHLCSMFLETYVRCFDSRQNLADAYSDQSCFQMSIWRTQQTREQCLLYMEYIRNFLKAHLEIGADWMRLAKNNVSDPVLFSNGHCQISETLTHFPRTLHILESIVADGWQTGSSVCLLVHGSFREPDFSLLERRFLRFFVLIPPRSTFPATIQHDFMYIVQDRQELNTDPGGVSLWESLPPLKQSVVREFSRNTRLTIPYCIQFLEENHWAVDKAFQAFKTAKTKKMFPRSAFKTDE